MREGESAYPLVDLLLASYRPEEFDNSSDRDGHAMSILTIGDVAELTLGEGRAREADGIVRLRTRSSYRNAVVPAFIDTFRDDSEMRGAKRGKGFGRGDNQW
ncbi:MAG: hypothetical protein LQ341_005099 [Variospora aurantia]|nr:MAG: hypothetical protein LQ341_005099 [Variospora aurantia]